MTGTVKEVLAFSFPRSETSGVNRKTEVDGKFSLTSAASMRPWLLTVYSTWNSVPGYCDKSRDDGSMVTTGIGT